MRHAAPRLPQVNRGVLGNEIRGLEGSEVQATREEVHSLIESYPSIPGNFGELIK